VDATLTHNHQGLAVRKLPTRDVGSAVGYYEGVPEYVEQLNQGLARKARVPATNKAIAPVVEAGQRGLFQRPATDIVPRRLQETAAQHLDDVYPYGDDTFPYGHNVSPTGQVFDFSVYPPTLKPLSQGGGISVRWARKRVSRGRRFRSAGL
jgi:hypothetical protein